MRAPLLETPALLLTMSGEQCKPLQGLLYWWCAFVFLQSRLCGSRPWPSIIRKIAFLSEKRTRVARKGDS